MLLLSSLYGVCLMQSADSFLTLFLGLEIMSLPVYVLVLLAYRRPQSAEAALKYLVLGGTATAMFLMGVSLLYGASGSMAIATFAQRARLGRPDGARGRRAGDPGLLPEGRDRAVPRLGARRLRRRERAGDGLHGRRSSRPACCSPRCGCSATAKLASPMLELLAVLPLVSIVWGNLAAMRQPSLRRMIAYSSIAHAGYLFYALLGDPAGRLQAVVFYLLAYGVLNLLAFAALPPAADDRERDRLDNLKGLFHRSPFAALMIGIAMLSLAGIPPFPGFVAKFLIFKNVMAAGYTTYAVLGLVGSYLGIYFYLRVIQFMFMSPDATVAAKRKVRGLPLGASLVCLAAAMGITLFPGWVIAML